MNNLLAQNTETITLAPQGQFAGLNDLTLAGVLSGLITFALVIAAIIFFFMLVIGGVKWIASGGDKGGTEAARNQITAALVGLVIVFAALAIANMMSAFFSINIFSLNLPTANNPQ